MVEAPIENTYAIVELYPDKIKVTGVGKEASRELPFKNAVNKKRSFK